jgi:hypothetical protein
MNGEDRGVAPESIAERPVKDSSEPKRICLVSQSFQRTDEFFVVSPAFHRVPVDLLPHLPGAGRGHGALRLMECEAALVPFEAEEI